jgi:hypothetical protein
VLLALSFAEACDLTPFELTFAIRVEAEERKRKDRLAASLVAELINISGRYVKKLVTGDQLLGLKPPAPTRTEAKARTVLSREDFVKEAVKRGRTYADCKAERGE